VFGLDAFIILLFFRIRKFCQRWRVPLVGRILRGLSLSLYGIELGIEIELGRAVYFVHSSGVVVGGKAVVGDFTRFYGSNTVGAGKDDGEPVIGSRVVVGAGARLLGPITIGDHVFIGANAVVLNDVASGKTVVGIPAKERP
jgi:serine O-acetyltransferase